MYEFVSRLWWWLCLTKDKCKHFRLGLRALLNNTLAQTSGYYKKSKQENAATYLRHKYKKKYISRPRVLRLGLMGEVLMQVAREKTTIRFLALRRPTCISFSYSHSPFTIFTYIMVDIWYTFIPIVNIQTSSVWYSYMFSSTFFISCLITSELNIRSGSLRLPHIRRKFFYSWIIFQCSLLIYIPETDNANAIAW